MDEIERLMSLRVSEINGLKKQLSETESSPAKEKEALVESQRKNELDVDQWQRDRSTLNDRVRQLKMDKKWILERGIFLAFRALKGTKKYNDALYTLTARADAIGRQEGMQECHACAKEGKSIEDHPNYPRDDDLMKVC
jgi:hypothetical protein